jgi:ankyrin repeat protein
MIFLPVFSFVRPYAFTHVSGKWAFGSNAGLECFTAFLFSDLILFPQIILSQKGVDKNPRTLQGNTPLHLAALNNREPAIKLLVKSVFQKGP